MLDVELLSFDSGALFVVPCSCCLNLPLAGFPIGGSGTSSRGANIVLFSAQSYDTTMLRLIWPIFTQRQMRAGLLLTKTGKEQK